MSLLGPYIVACALLVIAGTSKAIRPLTTVRVLGHVFPRSEGRGARALSRAVRGLALAEVALGVAGCLWPVASLAIVVAASYAGFALFLVYARARVPSLASCGCLPAPDVWPSRRGDPSNARSGRRAYESMTYDTVPASSTRVHVLLDVAMAASAASFAGGLLESDTAGSLFSVLSKQPLDGVPLVAACAVATWMVILWLVALPGLSRARQLVEAESTS